MEAKLILLDGLLAFCKDEKEHEARLLKTRQISWLVASFE